MEIVKITRPMLAAAATSADLDKLNYPLLASPKLDGIRCLVHPELGPVTRSFKPVANKYIREQLNRISYHGLDGELMVVDHEGRPLDFNPIQSAVMSRDGEPNFQFWVFDNFLENTGYQFRYQKIMIDWGTHSIIKPLYHHVLLTPEEARIVAAGCISSGYEGTIFRDPNGAYKSGRSTLKQQGMIKYKEFSDAEGTIIGFEEKHHNTNPDEKDEFGLAKRSHKKEGMQPAGTLGAVILSTKWGELKVGSGIDEALRTQIWTNQSVYLGKIVTFKYQTYGMQDLPRFPIFLRFREKE